MTMISSAFSSKITSIASTQRLSDTGETLSFSNCFNTTVSAQDQKNDALDALDSEMRHIVMQRGASADQITMINSIFMEAENSGISPVEAKAFLKSLSSDQLEALQVAHCLADPINIDTLSDEGAINLLLSEDSQLDVNNDGMVEVGIGVSFRMPPPNASDEVKAAWQDMTEGMDEKDLMIMQFYFISDFLTANIKTNQAGEVIGFYSHEDQEWTNPYADTSFSWKGQARKMLDNVEASKQYMSHEQYSQTKDFFIDWQATLIEYGIF